MSGYTGDVVLRHGPRDRDGAVLVSGEPILDRVLVVDDEEPVRRMIARMVTAGAEVECETASDAAEARMLLARTSFWLVICDVNMPSESGPELTAGSAGTTRRRASTWSGSAPGPRWWRASSSSTRGAWSSSAWRRLSTTWGRSASPTRSC